MASVLLTLNRFHPFFGVSNINVEQVNAGWFISIRSGIVNKTLQNIISIEIKWNFNVKWVNPFHAIDLFPYPLKIENQGFLDVSRGYRKGQLAWNELTKFEACMKICQYVLCVSPLVSRMYSNWKRFYSFTAESIQVGFLTSQLNMLNQQ